MKFWSNRKLIREDRWFKTFEMEAGVHARVSKFMTREANIREMQLKEEWDAWSQSERLIFAQAFGTKPEITREDERILEFLMKSTDERVLGSIASCLARHSSKKMVLAFLSKGLKSGAESNANFLDALGKLGDREAIPTVKALHDSLSSDIRREGTEANEWLILDFVVSCSTLNKLEGTTAYRDEIEPFLHHPNQNVRNFSRIWFDGGPPDMADREEIR